MFFLIYFRILDNLHDRLLCISSVNSKIFLSLRVFGQLFSSLLLFPQRFGRYVVRPSSGVCQVPEFDKHLKKAGGHIDRNVVEITIKMKTIVRIPLMTKINKLCLRNLDN